MPQTATDLTHLATVMVPVSDLDRAIDHYVGTLGFEKRTDVPYGDGERWVEVGPRGGDTTLALTPERDGWSVGRSTGVVLATGDIDATHARLRDAGVDADPDVMRAEGPAPPMFWLRDADGNQLLVIETS